MRSSAPSFDLGDDRVTRREIELTDRANVTLRLARVRPAVHELLGRDGVVDRLGTARIHATINQAIEAQTGVAETPGPDS